MKFDITTKPLDQIITDCLIVAISEKENLSTQAKQVNQLTNDQLKKIIHASGFSGEKGQTLLLPQLKLLKAKHILLIGIGKEKNLSARSYKQIIVETIKACEKLNIKHITSTLHELTIKNYDTTWAIRQTIISAQDSLYRYNEYKSKPTPAIQLNHLSFYTSANQQTLLKNSIKEGKAIANGIKLCKDLGFAPPNICHPTYLAKQARSISKTNTKLTTTVLNESDMKKLGMNAFLAVSQGSHQPGKLIIVHYKGAKKSDKPIILIGKGITFDTGGINIKPSSGMVDMKLDMCGGATVLGIMKVVSQLNLPINVIGIVAAAENMPDGNAARPSDIVKTMSGQTVEILNTDAEGRLVLCDALTYAKKFNPAVIIDIATLTGAVIIALGKVYSGLLSNNQPLANTLLQCGQTTDDKVWQLPFDDEYQELIKSEIADTANCNIKNREAGTITAACFLSKFVDNVKWAHLDIAGTAHIRGSMQPTGRAIQLLTQYLIDYAKN